MSNCIKPYFYTKVFGYSDDVLYIESDEVNKEIDCFEEDVEVYFSDGTVILFTYTSEGLWKCEVTNVGTALYEVIEADNAYSDNYSDIFYIHADFKRYEKV